jgi:DNA-binding CsgD family transcriptional regulator
MSINEELQSSNEELETSKEELQSLNEELNTVNAQLQDKVEELEGTNNDLANLLASTDVATIFLDTHFAIKRFTPAATRLEDKVYLSRAMTERLLRRASGGEPEALLPGDCLSDRELTVFQMIGQGLPTRDIAVRLHLSIKTIETYRENIKSKLGLKNSAELSRHAAQWALENS